MKTQIVFCRRTLLLSASIATIIGTVSAFALDIPLTDDSWTGQYSSYINTAKGTDDVAYISGASSGTAWNRRSWLKFNLFGPGGALRSGSNYKYDQIEKATLRVFMDAVTTSGTVQLYAAGAAWDESTLTHNTAPALLGDPGNGSAPYATQGISVVNKYVTFDVTELVRDWVDGSRANNGIVLVAGNPAVNVTIHTKENSGECHPASLHIAFTGARLNPRGDLSMGQFTNGPQP
jgi:hypothetical protein